MLSFPANQSKEIKKLRTIIISDVHIAAGPLDDHTDELENYLCDFIASLSTSEAPIELIINGDFFDFVQAAPWEENGDLLSKTRDGVRLCFTEQQSCEKLENIIKEHKPVFTMLNQFLKAHSGNTIRILPGNHDVDLFWPKVRSRLIEIIEIDQLEGQKRLIFHLEEHYVFERWGKKYWIEHGHQHDIVNRFIVHKKNYWSNESPPVLKDFNGIERLICCDGTFALIKYLNPLDADFPAIDNIKPWSRLVAALLWPGSPLGFRRALIVCGLLAKFLSHDIDIAVTLESDDQCIDLLRELVNSLSLSEQSAFIEFLKTQDIHVTQQIMSFLDDRNNCIRILKCNCFSSISNVISSEDLASISNGVLGYAKGTLFNYETVMLKKEASKVSRLEGVNHFIAGHTHEPTFESSDDMYFNSGCWVPNLEASKISQVQAVLVNDIELPILISYVEISSHDNGIPSVKKLVSR